MSLRRTLLALFLFALPLAAAEPVKPPEVKSPLTPKEAQKLFRLPPGLRIELVASEPQIESPVAMAFDEDGKLWVVEMRDYPNPPKPGEKPQGRIKVLEDKDGDGFYETATVVADNLLFANGIMPWKGGVVVTMAPQIVYIKNGKTEVLYEGFTAGNPQLRVSHPVLGLDGWVYVANGLRGGKVKKPGEPDAKAIDLSGRDFRFNLLTGEHEALSGMGQYGNCFDDWGRRFVCDNRHHLRHVVIEDRYLKRNPYLGVPAVVQDISELDKEEGPLSSGGRVYPISKNWTTSALHAGRFTAACGVQIYRGDLLPAEYRGCAFTCEPPGNLVHQEVLEPNGATFRSRPAKAGVEFLASPDDWFRPVFLANGPDGAMYVVDMYRAVIEHPEFMPPELKNRPDMTLGKDRGRIWRIVPEKRTTKAIRPNMSKVKTEDLDKYLDGKHNAWGRMTAHRLILERKDYPNPKLRGRVVFRDGDEYERLHFDCLAASYNVLDENHHRPLFLNEPDARVLEQLVRIAEPWLAKAEKHRTDIISRIGLDSRLDFQIALSLGEWDDDRIVEPLAKIALKRADDKWTRLAVASSVAKRSGKLVAVLQKGGLTSEASAGRLTLIAELSAVVGARQDGDEVADLLHTLDCINTRDARRWQMAGLDGLAEGMGRRGTQLGGFLKTLPADKHRAADLADRLLGLAAKVAADGKADPGERVTALRLMAHAPWTTAEPVLAKLVTEDGPQDVRLAAVRALSAHPRAEVAAILMKSWPTYTPALRREIIEAMLRQPDRALFLLGEIEAKRVKPGDLDAQRARQLVNHGKPEVREKAKKLLQDSLPAERKKVLEQYQAALKVKGDPKKGQEVFRKNCATCHRLSGIGVDVGPSIADTERTRTADALLVDILNPNAAIDANYINYQVTLKNGKVLTGLITAETAASLTLKRAENQTDTVLRQDVEEVRSTGTSLMPEGLEKTVSVEEMADLLGFLKNWRYLDGSVPVK
ncbi:MAG TPA: PVC-type heme-binding CxxCH protein [Gemmataceae bacterium]|nr:PVC-type heme-binding CxxCH protein [Gemmataceae bacterium]